MSGDGKDSEPPVAVRAESQDLIPPVLAEVIKTPEQRAALLSVLTQVTTTSVQATRGHYPPPAMMAEYKNIDPAINQQILAEAKTQGEHRRALEKLATSGAQRRMDKAQTNQQWVAIGGLAFSFAIVLVSFIWTKSVSWPLAAIAVLVAAFAVGGRPAATIFSAYFARRFPFPGVPSKPSDDDQNT